MAPTSPGNLGEVPAVEQKRSLALARAAAMKASQDLAVQQEAVRAEVESQIAAMKADMDRRLAEMRAQMEPLQREIRQIGEAIWTVDLYLGRDEEIVALRDNEALAAAPAAAPFTLRQAVLSMDEETAAHAESGGIDAMHVDLFDEWVAEPANLARVLPEAKGVVALVPRARGREYADPWLNDEMQKQNSWTYFLIRNGERLYRMRTDFVVGKRLVPATDEFTGLFVSSRYDHTTRQHESTPLTPGTPEWDAAAERQGARERHFMRMALILQGLVDRTTVFTPLPSHGLNLLDQRTYDDGHAVLVRDAEAVLTDGRPDFHTWLAAKNDNLRVGMRVMGAFNTEAFREAGHESHGSDYWRPNDRITPVPANRWSETDIPSTGVLYRLEGKKSQRGVTGFTFKFERAKRWIDGPGARAEYRTPKTRATCLVAPHDRFVLPYDLITVEECRYYLDARSQRAAYADMFPLLNAAIAAKETEVAQEAPFRHLLATALTAADPTTDATDPALPEAHRILDPLVDWWKLANKYHRALNGEPEHEAKALRDIVAEHTARQQGAAAQSGDETAEAAVVARLLAHDPSIMVVGRKRDGSYLAFAPQPRAYPAGRVGHPATNVEQPAPVTDAEKEANDALHPVHRVNPDVLAAHRAIPAAVADNVWAIEYTTGKTGRTIKSRHWAQPGTRLDKTRLLHTTEAWDAFEVHADPNEHLTDPEIDVAVADLLADAESHARAGWPSGRRLNARTMDPFEPLILGVCLRTDRGEYGQGPHFQVHMIDAADPAGLAEAPAATANNKIKPFSARVDAYFSKTRNGLVLARSETTGTFRLEIKDSGSRYSGAPISRPWHYFWGGQARHAIALIERPANQTIAEERDVRIRAHNAAVSSLRDAAYSALTHAHQAATEALEAAAYARFLDDYADPSLWEGHRKSLPQRGFVPSWHQSGNGVPEPIMDAIFRAADEDLIEKTIETRTYESTGNTYEATLHQVPGHTIGNLMKRLAVETDESCEPFLGLRLFVKPQERADEPGAPEGSHPTAPETADPETGTDDTTYEGHRITPDGAIVITGTVVSDVLCNDED